MTDAEIMAEVKKIGQELENVTLQRFNKITTEEVFLDAINKNLARIRELWRERIKP